MVHHWISNNVKQSGYDDMVLLSKISEDGIYDNLKKRFMDNFIFTYIGPVLISVNPYKELPYFSEKEVEQYNGASQIENPPHIYAVADFMYRNMLIDNENQCVIISGESGAGKTVCAKYIMGYISKVSGGNNSSKVQNVKNIILQSNPLLEAFGNAKTLRNNNSSRFGKYVEIQFTRSGEPDGGKITNFLLEKSRVIGQIKKERNFHIFYQLCASQNEDLHKKLGIQNASRFNYLSRSECFNVDGIDDAKDFEEVCHAMSTCHLTEADQFSIFKIIAGILHLGNISFVENGSWAQTEHDKYLEYPSHLLGISKESLRTKLVSRTIETKSSNKQERIEVNLNVEQAEYTRDALAKGIYSRLFDHLVTFINQAMEIKSDNLLNTSILDIYGFEIFNQNGFEQFCINYVNEKLQQIFIELTLKAEQEEYRQEGIKWTDVDFFNNKIVCDLIESKNSPPGIFSISDDVVKTIHATGDGVDGKLLQKLKQSFSSHAHFSNNSDGFLIKHYAGEVDYKIEGFCEKNRDVLFQDLVDLMKTSSEPFIRNLFPEQTGATGKIPTTAGRKITTQANQLVDKLMKCYPSYIRCIKPNETKRPQEIDENRVKHQIKYLGLVENVRVRRAGYAYRREFDKFIRRYGIVNKQTTFWRGPHDQGIQIIMNTVNIDPGQYQMGKTKVFIKAPESLFLLEELRDRKFNAYALVLQKAFRKFNAIQYFLRLKNEAADLLFQQKERRTLSLNRKFYCDYMGLDTRPDIRLLIHKRENVEFAQTVWKYDRKFSRQLRDLILTNKAVYLIGRELVKDKASRQKRVVCVIKRRIEFAHVSKVSLSHLADNFVVITPVGDDYSTIFELNFKTEFLTTFAKRFKEALNRQLPVEFSDQTTYLLKKEGWGGGGQRTVRFTRDMALKDVQVIAPGLRGKICDVKVPPGLPSTTRPTATYYQQYNFESEPWWPKFDRLKTKFGITIIKGDRLHQPRSNGVKKQTTNSVPANTIYSSPVPNGEPGSMQQTPQSTQIINSTDHIKQQGFSYLNPGQIGNNVIKPPIKKRKPPAPEPNYPKCTALYEYTAADIDELSFNEGDTLYIVKEDPSGWWHGICRGKTGLFPSNYVQVH